MNPQTESSAGSNHRLYDALLDYARSPGKSNVSLREPALLFASFRQILQIAAGRALEAESMNDERKAALRRAACFFTRTALLYPGADHYTLMGLDRNFDGAALKDHYRLLMRLIHPDFAGTLPFAWPADAAVRVNLAYEVLSSPVRRSEYEKSMAHASQMPSPPKVEQRRTALVLRKPRAGISRSRFRQFVLISTVAGTCAVLISLLMSGQEPVRLVQRGQLAVAKPAAERVAAAGQAAAAPEIEQPQPTAPPDPVLEAPTQPHASPAAAVSALMNKMFTAATSQRPPVAQHVARPQVQAPQAQAPQPAPVETHRLPSATPPDNAAANVTTPSPVPASTAVVYLDPAPMPAPARAPLPAPVTNPAPPTVAVAVPVAVPVAAPVAAPVARPVPLAGVTLGEAQPLLAKLLLQLESGSGERVIGLLERDARSRPGAQALSRHYDELVEGMRPVRLAQVEFNAEPADGRLLVTGHVNLQSGGLIGGPPLKKMVLRAEFESRNGTVVMTGLSGVPPN
jgi:hypothetical protein